MIITDDHREWEVVRRYQHLLRTSATSEFNVTTAYSLLGSILCWTVQRIRPHKDEQGLTDNLARSVSDRLKGQTLGDWGIQLLTSIGPTSSLTELSGNYPEPFDALTFLIGMRDAFAHGDGRRTIPLTSDRLPTELVGFQIELVKKDRAGKVIWSGTLRIFDEDMRKIGDKLADVFCRGLRDEHGDDSHFGEDARSSLHERGLRLREVA